MAATIKELAKMRKDGLTYKQIAARVGSTRYAVKSRLLRNGIRRNNVTQRQWIAALSRPHTNEELARRFHVSIYAVKKYRQRFRSMGVAVLNSTVVTPAPPPAPILPYPDHTLLPTCSHGETDGACPICEREQRNRLPACSDPKTQDEVA